MSIFNCAPMKFKDHPWAPHSPAILKKVLSYAPMFGQTITEQRTIAWNELCKKRGWTP